MNTMLQSLHEEVGRNIHRINEETCKHCRLKIEVGEIGKRIFQELKEWERKYNQETIDAIEEFNDYWIKGERSNKTVRVQTADGIQLGDLGVKPVILSS